MLRKRSSGRSPIADRARRRVRIQTAFGGVRTNTTKYAGKWRLKLCKVTPKNADKQRDLSEAIAAGTFDRICCMG